MKVLNGVARRAVYKFDWLFQLYFKIIFKPRNALEIHLNNISKKNLFFVQIGANDGLWNDPLYKFIRRDKWRGFLIEPQKDVFHQLRDNYNKITGLIFENVAIAEENGQKELYKISFTKERWATGISSFKKEDIIRLIDAGYVSRMALKSKLQLPEDKNSWINTETVTTITFADLIEKHKVAKLDVLMLDVEGYEFEILKTIPFERVSIKNIIYEHSHFKDFERQRIESFLREWGYSLEYCTSDTIAISQTE